MDGIFNVLKPPGMTSHDVVAFLRRALHTKKSDVGELLTLMRQEFFLFLQAVQLVCWSLP